MACGKVTAPSILLGGSETFCRATLTSNRRRSACQRELASWQERCRRLLHIMDRRHWRTWKPWRAQRMCSITADERAGVDGGGGAEHSDTGPDWVLATSLAHYLKALGILRLVVGRSGPRLEGRWQNNTSDC